MDDQQVRTAVCHAAQELWSRGLLAGDDGIVCVDLTRRRYLVAAPGTRKANLQPHQAREVDLDGEIVGATREGVQHAVPPAYWRPCMLAFQAGAHYESDARPAGPSVRACLIVQPVALMALLHRGQGATQITLASGRRLPVIDLQARGGEDTLKAAIGETPGILLPGVGLFVPAATLDRALNRAERLAHDAAITLAALAPDRSPLESSDARPAQDPQQSRR